MPVLLVIAFVTSAISTLCLGVSYKRPTDDGMEYALVPAVCTFLLAIAVVVVYIRGH